MMVATKPKVAFLLSNWYSGATLLTILLNSHSQIVSNGEAMFFLPNDSRRYDCSCGKYIDECEFYKATTAHMRLPGDAGWDKQLFVQVPRFSHKPLVNRVLNSARIESALRHRVINAVPAYRNIRERFLAAQLQFFDNARSVAGASIYLDGTKSMRRAELFAHGDRCEMKALHLIRDGRGFCASYVKSERRSLTDAAKAWVRHIARVDAFSKDFPSVPVLVVRYEDLCRSTALTIRSVCEFLGISYEEPGEDMMKDAHILGNRMRRTFGGAILEDTSWREKIDSRAQSELTSMMKPQLERFGYL